MIKVFSHPHTMFAACILVNRLNELGFASVLADKIQPADKSVYIIYNASGVKQLPKNYIVYQTEVPGSKWFTPRYHDIIKRAVGVWDYSPANTSAYKHGKVFIVPPGISAQPTVHKDIDVLFYGWLIGSKHRNEALARINRKVYVHVTDNALEGKAWALLRRSKVVVNLHYYANAPLEVFRVNEALSFNCHVVSEHSIHGDEHYNGLVEFRSVNDMAPVIQKLVRLPFKRDIARLCNKAAILQAVEGCL